MNIYIKNLEKVEKIKPSNIVSKMAVEDGKLGYLPKNIYYILNEYVGSSNDEFLRYGVPIGNNSFISAILLALDPDYKNISDKIKYTQDFRNNLAAVNFSTVIQELYDSTSTQFAKDIMDPSVPFDSKLFVQL